MGYKGYLVGLEMHTHPMHNTSAPCMDLAILSPPADPSRASSSRPSSPSAPPLALHPPTSPTPPGPGPSRASSQQGGLQGRCAGSGPGAGDCVDGWGATENPNVCTCMRASVSHCAPYSQQLLYSVHTVHTPPHSHFFTALPSWQAPLGIKYCAIFDAGGKVNRPLSVKCESLTECAASPSGAC